MLVNRINFVITKLLIKSILFIIRLEEVSYINFQSVHKMR